MLISIIRRFLSLIIITLPTYVAAAVSYPSTVSCQTQNIYNIGAGIYDITGPAAEQGMMGYGMVEQKTSGIYQRLWARAFIIESPCSNHRIVFVNADLGQIFQGIKQQVIKKLQAKYGNQYSDENVLLTATHTHSGPGGYSTYFFYNITTLGFSRKNFDVIVDGIVAAIERAQANITPAHIKVATGSLLGINYNRSPQSYSLNPVEERNRYKNDTDTNMTLLRFDSVQGKSIGMLNWFPIHGTSMNNKNKLINGDNKGYAEYLFEKSMQSDYGPTAFVAAFAQENAGDVSPHPYGHEGGTGREGLKNIEQAGKAQYETAKKLYDSATEIVTGDIGFRHTFIDLGHVKVNPEYTHTASKMTCPAAIGVSMLAGTQDGEGIGWQGINCDNLHSALPYFICQIVTNSCQGDKPVLVTTGEIQPYPWTPQILPMQLMKVGNVVIGAVPLEIATMAGRRLKDAIANQLPSSSSYHIVLSALANAYAGYVTTNEEYQLQRYESASTHFGPWTAAALQQIFGGLTKALVAGEAVESGPQPPNYIENQGTLQTGVVFDDKPIGKKFGDVYQDANGFYTSGQNVKVTFWGGHPKNNYHTQHTYLEVQQLIDGIWKTIRTDNDWDTEYHWQRNGIAYSLATIVWRIPSNISPGQYRLVHYGDWKSGWSRKIYPYTGYSKVFTVKPLGSRGDQ